MRKKQISKWLSEMLEAQDPKTGEPKSKVLAKTLINIAMDEKQGSKLRLEAIEMIMDRNEGKPMQVNANADITVSPLADIPTEVLEEIKKKAEALKGAMEK